MKDESNKLNVFGKTTIIMTCFYTIMGTIVTFKIISLLSDLGSKMSFLDDSFSGYITIINMFLIFQLCFTIVLGLTSGLSAVKLAPNNTNNDYLSKLMDRAKEKRESREEKSNKEVEKSNIYDDLDI